MMAHLHRGLLLIGLLLAGIAPLSAGDVEAGRLLYQFGQTAAGEPVRADAFGGTELAGESMACVRCHRRSGFGSYEGGYYIPPITQPYLFGGRQLSRDDRFRALFMQAQTAEFRHQVRRIRDREPYTAETLHRAVAEGIDPDGRVLDPLMPRYRISETDLANLQAYLETLSAGISPGITETHVELAVVVHSDVPAAEREALVGTLESFVEWYNERTRGDMRLAGHSVYGSSLYTRYARLYRLHVWELDGAPETWAGQLDRLNAERPAFALVSGKVDGPWIEIGRWADRNAVPSVFPITDLPHEPGPLGGYTVYFSQGRLLEAELMPVWLVREGVASVVQLVGPRAVDQHAAERLKLRAARSGLQVETRAMDQVDALPEAGALVVWNDVVDADQLAAWRRQTGAGAVLLPAEALASLPETLEPKLAEALRFSYPYALVTDYYPERHRARAWMNTRGLDYAAEDVQIRAWYAMSMFRDSFIHLLDHFHRDFLLEVLEHQIQGSPNPGLYPDLQLAPEQRFASRSGYIVRLNPALAGGVEPVGERIVP
ncbi:MAG: hypothetical protein RQ729_07425 [Wenzhouxiangellaceae bacterium]|nr:hypothetical protein [Wenzhouxiangellaceae bacterium]